MIHISLVSGGIVMIGVGLPANSQNCKHIISEPESDILCTMHETAHGFITDQFMMRNFQ